MPVDIKCVSNLAETLKYIVAKHNGLREPYPQVPWSIKVWSAAKFASGDQSAWRFNQIQINVIPHMETDFPTLW